MGSAVANSPKILSSPHSTGKPPKPRKNWRLIFQKLGIVTPQAGANRRARRGFQLAASTSYRTLQHALGEVITRLAANKLDVHRADLLLYSLQIASQTLPTNVP